MISAHDDKQIGTARAAGASPAVPDVGAPSGVPLEPPTRRGMTVERVADVGSSWSITFGSGQSSQTMQLKKHFNVEPRAGDTIDTWESGNVVRGVALNGEPVFYSSAEQLEQRRSEWRQLYEERFGLLPEPVPEGQRARRIRTDAGKLEGILTQVRNGHEFEFVDAEGKVREFRWNGDTTGFPTSATRIEVWVDDVASDPIGSVRGIALDGVLYAYKSAVEFATARRAADRFEVVQTLSATCDPKQRAEVMLPNQRTLGMTM